MFIHPCLSNTIVIESEDISKKTFPKFEKEIIVDTECGCAVLRGAHIFAPGVLGMVSGKIYISVLKFYIYIQYQWYHFTLLVNAAIYMIPTNI